MFVGDGDGRFVQRLRRVRREHVLWPLPIALNAPIAEIGVRTDAIVAVETVLNEVSGLLSRFRVRRHVEVLEQRPWLERDLQSDGEYRLLRSS